MERIRRAAGLVRRRLLSAMKATGALGKIADSRWRRERLLILCYHGVSIDDEHRWRPALFVSAEQLRARMEILHRGGYAVLGIEEGVRRLFSGTLPPRSVVLTFDDGTHDFHARALPVLREFGYSATVYQRTDYAGARLPVFLVMLSYLLWKGRGQRVALKWRGLDLWLETSSAAHRRRSHGAISSFVHSGSKLSPDEKDDLLTAIARVLDVDYARIKAKRILQVMDPDEIREVAAANIDIELHMHNHHSPRDEQEYKSQIRQNRRVVESLSGRPARHFCYPSGEYADLFLPWLRDEGIVSATTGVPGLAKRSHDPLLLPRFIDTTQRSTLDFESWLTGAASFLARPRRS